MFQLVQKSGLLLVFLIMSLFRAMAEAPASSTEKVMIAGENPLGFDPGEVILDHISDSHEWHFFDYKGSDGDVIHASVCLPVILYTPGAGLDIFSFKNLHHSPYKAFTLEGENNIIRTDGRSFYDFSITKNVMQELIAVLLILLVLLSVGRNYKRYGTTNAPRGLQSAIEVIVIFIRDQVAKPLLGAKSAKYLPYLLTIFFFIWINNMLGLFPGSANVTGNIAVTMTLAAFTFILILLGSKKAYWSHIFAPQGVPTFVKFILIPIEFLSLFIKPIALMIRLFANMIGGHFMVLSLLMIIFIFTALFGISAGLGASVFSVAFAIFIYFLELLVAALQAYVFTILSAVFISEAVADGHGPAEQH
ncbi:MAG: F0F1 ATP synthase subunit A [Chitinophagales bacterium]|nr:F0F1 ATP synthase subunit A [Chitinophagales bacterium]